jgi:ribosomal protein S18 acetylase RimI-like enzyme
MRLRLPKISPQKALVILGICGMVSFFLYLQFITRRAFLFDYYTRATNFGTIVGANKNVAYATFVVFLLLFGVYILSWWAAGNIKNKEAWTLVFGWAALLCIPMVLLYPFGARDIFDYILRARIFTVYGQNPFFQTASAFPTDPFFNYGWWKEFPSPYGPFWELLAGLGVRLAGDGVLANIFVFKSISIIFLFATAAFIALTLKKHAPDRALQGTLLFLWNPLVLFEIVGNAHNDITMLVWMAASIWAAANKRWSLTVWFLALGAVFKFIPILLLPTAGLIGLANHSDTRNKLKFFFLTAAGCLIIWFIAYLPFWDGPETLTFLKQSSLLTTSIASLVFYNFQTSLGKFGRQIVSNTAIVLTVVFSFWMALRSIRKPDWESFAKSATLILFFYVLVTCTWYQNWYLLWPLTTAVFLPGGLVMQTAVLFSVTGLAKPFIAMPMFTWLAKPGSPVLQENNLTLVTQFFPWSISLYLLVKSGIEQIRVHWIRQQMPIRQCLPEDLPAVVNLISQLAIVSGSSKEFQLPQFKQMLQEMQSQPDIYANYVYLSEGKITGFISVVFYRTFFHRVGTAQVNELVIDEAYRGKGIGQALMKAAELEARRRGMDELEVGTESENLAAQKFYRKYGFDEEYVLFGMEFAREPDYPPAIGGKNPNSSPS